MAIPPGNDALSGYEFSIETSNGAICRYSQNEQPVVGVTTGTGRSDRTYIEISVAIPLLTGGQEENRCQELAKQEEERGLLDKVAAFNDMGLLSEAELNYWKDQLLSLPEDVTLEEDFTFEADFDGIADPVACIGECP